MKYYLLMIFFIFSSFLFAKDENCCPCEQEAEEEECVKFKRLPVYENSLVRDPIEKEPINRRPNSYESSFYEQLTR
ncbi:MAG TPA: hypothetical protein PLC42_07650 [Parachlamydiaceae bacterium]|nr:hypothetical protein [Parachlamydiaceae bacterium]